MYLGTMTVNRARANGEGAQTVCYARFSPKDRAELFLDSSCVLVDVWCKLDRSWEPPKIGLPAHQPRGHHSGHPRQVVAPPPQREGLLALPLTCAPTSPSCAPSANSTGASESWSPSSVRSWRWRLPDHSCLP